MKPAYPPERQVRRRKVLDKVRAQLESPQPPEKPVRVLKTAKPLKKIEQHWQPGQVVAFRRASGRLVLARDVTGIVRAVSGGVYCALGMRDGHWNELDSCLDEEFDKLPVK